MLVWEIQEAKNLHFILSDSRVLTLWCVYTPLLGEGSHDGFYAHSDL